jgi:hypothetical protein
MYRQRAVQASPNQFLRKTSDGSQIWRKSDGGAGFRAAAAPADEIEPRRNGLMPVRDRYHDTVKNALIKDGWTITDDPLHVKWGKKDLYVGNGGSGASDWSVHHLSRRPVPRRARSCLVPRVNEEVYNNLFDEPIGELLLENRRIRLIVFDPHTETIRQWIPQNPIAG